MRLSIVNYPKTLSPKMRTTVTTEDEAILKAARELSEEMNLGRGAMIVSEVLHTDLVNLNNRAYKKKGMEEAVKSFVHPYPTPFIMHHDMGGGGMFGGGDPKLLSIGTNIVANYYARRTETANGIASGYVKVGTFIPETSLIGATRAIDAIQSRQLFALSIGASVSDNNYLCTICGNPVNSQECEHIPGKIYEGTKCVAEVFNPVFKEYSAVYSPSDVVASIKRMDVSESSANPLFATESRVVDSGLDICEISLYDLGTKIYTSAGNPSNIQSKEEGHQADMTTKDSTPAEPTAPESATTVVEEKIAPAQSDVLMAKTLDIITKRCEKSDEMVTATLGVIKELVAVIGDLRTEKLEPVVSTTTEPTVTKTESSEPATEPEVKTEETTAGETEPAVGEGELAPETTEPSTQEPESKTEGSEPDTSVTTEESTPSSSAEPETTPSQTVSTTESTPAQPIDVAAILAKRRAAAVNKKKRGFGSKPGKRF